MINTDWITPQRCSCVDGRKTGMCMKCWFHGVNCNPSTNPDVNQTISKETSTVDPAFSTVQKQETQFIQAFSQFIQPIITFGRPGHYAAQIFTFLRLFLFTVRLTGAATQLYIYPLLHRLRFNIQPGKQYCAGWKRIYLDRLNGWITTLWWHSL